MIRVVKLVVGWLVWRRKRMRTTMAPIDADQHERLSHPELVRQDAEDDEGHGVGPPEPGVEVVGVVTW